VIYVHGQFNDSEGHAMRLHVAIDDNDTGIVGMASHERRFSGNPSKIEFSPDALTATITVDFFPENATDEYGVALSTDDSEGVFTITPAQVQVHVETVPTDKTLPPEVLYDGSGGFSGLPLAVLVPVDLPPLERRPQPAPVTPAAPAPGAPQTTADTLNPPAQPAEGVPAQAPETHPTPATPINHTTPAQPAKPAHSSEEAAKKSKE
jgi:hypothetical protein